MPLYYIWTIGCQMNKAESERLGSLFEQIGYQPSASTEEADLIVLNSCVIRQSAENKVVSKIGALKSLKKNNPCLKIALTGCLVDANIDKLQKRFPIVDYFFAAGEMPPWIDKCLTANIIPLKPTISTFINIIQGCNNFCSYCIVPYRRGREKSRSMDEIVCEARTLVERGAREIVLVGQNVDSYGHDLPDKSDLASLLTEINKIEGLKRLRFLTNHPKDMSDRLIDAIASLDKVCEEINLPVQAGDDQILKAMRRGYTAAHYRELVKRIRAKVPDIAITTDIIVGFPGETEEQFKASVDLLKELRFDNTHIAAYSPRTGTIASREYEDDVPTEVKKERVAIVEKLQGEIAAEINATLLGSSVEVLIEGKKQGKWQGRSRRGKLVFFNDKNDLLGQVVRIKIEKTSPWSLQGILSTDNGC
ncbi:MAG: tRNA (N6-isopentenyl adenosine(37)-C2)-methylthiotransferase MiaB [Dehalococcoidales bacterium]|nr:tRNA (N6-isopentenyl adenosine(37)-C2)-methylthiotransferase MiaB [Dehalococcoidales bacterium]